MKIAAYIDETIAIEKNIFVPILKEIANSSSHTEIVYFSKKIIPNLSKKESQIIIPPKLPAILKASWLKNKIQKQILKENISVLVCENFYLKSKIIIPQYVLISNLQKAKFVSNNAVHIFVAENIIKEEIIKLSHIENEKITVTYYGNLAQGKNYAHLQKEHTKNELTNGYDYFLFVVDKLSNLHLIKVLKAFSIFKRWQKSSIKLVLALDDVSQNNLIEDFENYKYKDEIFFFNDIKDGLIAASYAVINFSNYTIGSYLFTALQNNVPLILHNNDINKTVFHNAALYVESDEKSISESMQLLYKNEIARNTMIKSGVDLLLKYDDNKAATLIREKYFIKKNKHH